MRKPKVYLAAAYGRKIEIAGYREELRRLGLTVTSRWMDEPHTPDAGVGGGDTPLAFALNDLDDVLAADVLISFTDGTLARGGRHVEYGFALATAKELWIVGPIEHIFHHLADRVFPSWEAVMSEAHGVKEWFA